LSSEALNTGLIVASYGRRFLVEAADGRVRDCVTRGKRNDYACGDRVAYLAQDDTQGVIDHHLPRNTLLYRSDVWKQKLIAANVTQMIMVVASEPSFDLNVVDCCLAAASHANIHVLIVLNKADLATAPVAQQSLQFYANIGYAHIQLSAKNDIDILRPYLQGHRSVLVGESGMGKSTILNKLLPAAGAHTQSISLALGTGKHTTSNTRLHHLDADSEIIDTPGVQAFGIHHLEVADLAAAFIEFRPYLGHCHFRDCRHLSEPNCALIVAHAAGHIETRRLESYRHLATLRLRPTPRR